MGSDINSQKSDFVGGWGLLVFSKYLLVYFLLVVDMKGKINKENSKLISIKMHNVKQKIFIFRYQNLFIFSFYWKPRNLSI